MTELVLLLTLWPFHHKKPPVVSDSTGIRFGSPECYKSGYCTIIDRTADNAGEDGMIGFSSFGCEAAINNWRTLHMDPVKMSRS